MNWGCVLNPNRIAVLIAAASVFLSVAGCSNSPDESLAIARIEKYYHNDIVAPKNIKKINGWENGDNVYVVEYACDLTAKCNYEDCILELVGEAEKNPEAYSPKGFLACVTTSCMRLFWVTLVVVFSPVLCCGMS